MHELTHEDFYDFKEFITHLGQNFKCNEEASSFKFSEIKIIRVEKKTPGAFFYKLSFSEKEFRKVDLNMDIDSPLNIRKRTRISPKSTNVNKKVDNIHTLKLKKAYKSKLPINERKKKGLLDLLKKETIPKFYASFYESL